MPYTKGNARVQLLLESLWLTTHSMGYCECRQNLDTINLLCLLKQSRLTVDKAGEVALSHESCTQTMYSRWKNP